ncbi:MAG: AAA family ATPase [Ktedonobacteraceae bacterium]
MIIFINGAFGVGKTTVAEQLVARIPNSLLFDAEEVGGFLRTVLKPIDNTDDFQHLPMWRTLTITTARLLKETYGRHLVMPMTIWHRPYFDEIIGGLRAIEPDFYHFCLTATEKTLYERLQARGDSPEVFRWCWKQDEQCLAAFQSPAFAVHIATDDASPTALMAEILGAIQHTNTSGGG